MEGKPQKTAAAAKPPVANREDWLKARLALLEEEKEATKRMDGVSAQRRRLPMVRIDKQYSFDGPAGKLSLADMFGEKRQLIVYHFMFDPAWDKGCMGCTGLVNAIGDLSLLEQRDTHFVLVSRAPLEKLEAYKEQHGWQHPWYSSFGSDFNYDFHVTIDESVAPVLYNYRSKEELQQQGFDYDVKGEMHGLSVFFRDGEDIFHTYSTFGRGCEGLVDAYRLLDVTPFGRQEDWEDSPAGWPQQPTYGA